MATFVDQDGRNKVHTTVRNEGADTIVRYHDTDIVRFNHDYVWLNTGGFNTATTKRRINQAAEKYDLGFWVYQKDHEWFIQEESYGETIWFNEEIKMHRPSVLDEFGLVQNP
jgi:hypothetical protein